MSLDNLGGRRALSIRTAEPAKTAVRQRYEAPKLVRYGHVAELTEGSSAGKKTGAPDAKPGSTHFII
jgi:hypothetical protein